MKRAATPHRLVGRYRRRLCAVLASAVLLPLSSFGLDYTALSFVDGFDASDGDLISGFLDLPGYAKPAALRKSEKSTPSSTSSDDDDAVGTNLPPGASGEQSSSNPKRTRATLNDLFRGDNAPPSPSVLSLLGSRRAMWASPGCRDVSVSKDSVRWGFDILLSSLKHRPLDIRQYPAEIVEMQRRRLRCPAFFTWHQRVSEGPAETEDDYKLRGCIGTLSAITPDEIGTYAWIAAKEDQRFSPVELKEMPRLRGTLTILHSFEIAKHPLDWELGVHGLAADFNVKGDGYWGVFLPEVMLKFKSKERCIIELIRKAEYFGPITTDLINSVRLTKFQGKPVSLSFDEYVQTFGEVFTHARREKVKERLPELPQEGPEEYESTADETETEDLGADSPIVAKLKAAAAAEQQAEEQNKQ